MLRISKEDIIACENHQRVIDEAIKRLTANNAVSFKELIAALRLYAMSSALRWDYIRQLITDRTGRDLIPLAPPYFQHHPFEDEIQNPGTYTAGTGGVKRTVGFAWYGDNTAHLFKHNLLVVHNQIDGKTRRYTKRLEDVTVRLTHEPEAPAEPTLPLPPVMLKQRAS